MLTRFKQIRQKLTPARYWTEHNVTLHHEFKSRQDSLDYFHWRNAQYFGYIEHMPVSGQDDKLVLDYGCGPGHDLVGFGVYSRPSRLIGADVSRSSLEEAERRLAMHGVKAEMIQVDETKGVLPLPDASVDYVHSSGVLHHVVDPLGTLREIRRLLRPGGLARVMVYNYDSLWLHFYTAYQTQLVGGKYSDLDVRAAFAKTTDGETCPISRVYRPAEFAALAAQAGFAAQFVGAAVSVFEVSLLAQRFAAIMDRNLASEHREFLCALEMDKRGLPTYLGHYAGVDGCYLLSPA